MNGEWMERQRKHLGNKVKVRSDKRVDDDLGVAYGDTEHLDDPLLGEIYYGIAGDEAKKQTTTFDAEDL